MSSPFQSAKLNLKLFELRREPALREARNWFVRDCNPESFSELVVLIRGEHNTSFRMVLSYWNMAASLVTTGAIEGESFREAHDEIFATFSKIEPYLAELRAVTGEADFCKQMEAVVLAAPNALQTLVRRRVVLRVAAKTRQLESETCSPIAS